MKKNANIIWLIIFLCMVIFGLYTLWGYNWHQQQLKNIQEQNKQLQDKLDSLIFQSPTSLKSATPSASPAKEATFSSPIILPEDY